MHNGFIDGFTTIKRDLVLTVDELLYPEIKGQTDTEALFYLALTFGLEDDPPDVVARAVRFVETCGGGAASNSVPGHPSPPSPRRNPATAESRARLRPQALSRGWWAVVTGG